MLDRPTYTYTPKHTEQTQTKSAAASDEPRFSRSAMRLFVFAQAIACTFAAGAPKTRCKFMLPRIIFRNPRLATQTHTHTRSHTYTPSTATPWTHIFYFYIDIVVSSGLWLPAWAPRVCRCRRCGSLDGGEMRWFPYSITLRINASEPQLALRFACVITGIPTRIKWVRARTDMYSYITYIEEVHKSCELRSGYGKAYSCVGGSG